MGAQPGPGAWESPLVLFPQEPNRAEIAHAALIPHGPDQGKVVFWRVGWDRRAWIWDPAAPSAVAYAGQYDPTMCSLVGVSDNLFCAGHAWNADGDLIVAGGHLNWYVPGQPGFMPCGSPGCPCASPQPTWAYLYSPVGGSTSPSWLKIASLLEPPGTPPPPMEWGYYYPSVISLNNRWMLLAGGTCAPKQTDPSMSACLHCPQRAELYSTRSNGFQLLDPSTSTWQGPNGASGLAYPGLPTGQVQTQSHWPGPNPITWIQEIDGLHYYPIMHLLRSGYVFASAIEWGARDMTTGPQDFSPSALLDVREWPPSGCQQPGCWQWKMQHPDNRFFHPVSTTKPINLHDSTAVLEPYRVNAVGQVVSPEAVLMIGGHDQQDIGTHDDDAFAQVWRIENPHLTAKSAYNAQDPGTDWKKWSEPAPGSGTTTGMKHPRVWANAVLLPDLSVFVVGGATRDFHPYAGVPTESNAFPVYEPEILEFLNTSGSQNWPVWHPVAHHQSPRLYHSVALLLKDGRVLSMGGYKTTVNTTPVLEHSDVEIYSPPYLFADVPRPTITGSVSIGYGVQTLVSVAVGDLTYPADEIEFATLIRCGSVTHHFDWDQRCIRLDVAGVIDNSSLKLARLPAADEAERGHYLAPPGWYMLFVVRKPTGTPAVRVPSVARFVKLQ